MRPSEDEGELFDDLDKDEDEEKDPEDEFKEIKTVIKQHIEIDKFLKEYDLMQLKPLVKKAGLKNLEDLRSFPQQEIYRFMGPESRDTAEKLIQALDSLSLTGDKYEK